MARSVVKICKTCGVAFESPLVNGQVSSTVNCPKHRGRKQSMSRVRPAYGQTSRHRCKTCGKVFDKGDAYKHRRETGHSF